MARPAVTERCRLSIAGHSQVTGPLTPRERVFGEALAALSSGDFAKACTSYHIAISSDSSDFVGWYGLGECQRRDNAVFRDDRSESGWSFRSSYRQALAAYLRAFELMPTMHRLFRGDGYSRLRDLLKTGSGNLREGLSVGRDFMRFLAYPSWVGDTLGFVPWVARDVQRALPRTVPASHNVAVDNQRRVFHEIASAWAASLPQNADAAEALAIAEELVGSANALEICRRAREMTKDPQQSLRLAVSEFWLRLKFAIPDNAAELVVARQLADSLLRYNSNATGEAARRLAGLALITGRVRQAASLISRSDHLRVFGPNVRDDIARLSQALVAVASYAEPRDTIRTWVKRIEAGIANSTAVQLRDEIRGRTLGRAISLAFPRSGFIAPARAIAADDYLLAAEVALATSDTLRTRRLLDSVAFSRQNLRPADIAIDAAYPEAWLRGSMGDSIGAVAQLDSTLDAISLTPPLYFDDVARPGALIQAMLLRERIARSLLDRASHTSTPSLTQWGCVAMTLLANADTDIKAITPGFESTTRNAGCSATR